MSILFRDFLEENQVPCFPMCVSIHPKADKNGNPTGEKLENGELKMAKMPLGEKYENAILLKNFYGDEVANWIIKTKCSKCAWREDWGGFHALDTNYFDMPKHLLKIYCEKRWEAYDKDIMSGSLSLPKIWNKFKNKREKAFNTIAYDTRVCGVIDIDCLYHHPLLVELMKCVPWKGSNTKTFGRHIFIFDPKILAIIAQGKKKLRTKLNFPLEFGKVKKPDGGYAAGVEYLSGLWGWSPIDAMIENPERAKNPVPEAIIPYLVKLNANIRQLNNTIQRSNMLMGGETKGETKEPQTAAPEIPMAIGVLAEPGASVHRLDIIAENLAKYSVEKMANVGNASGVIIGCASSGCERVYQLVLASCMRLGANYSNEAWVRGRWDSYDAMTHIGYKERFDNYWSKKQREAFPWKKFMLDEDMYIQKQFVKTHKHNFIYNAYYEEHNLCYFNELTTLWKHNRKKGVAKKVIKKLLMNQTREYWEERMTTSIEAMEDPALDDEGNQPPNKFKEVATKFMNKTLKKFHSPTGWSNATTNNIIALLECELEEEFIQFNLMPITQDLFQFKNKAYDLRSGGLIERTREMYISAGGVLDYEFPECGDISELDAEMGKIDRMMKTILPDDNTRELFCLWRGYNLTGHTNAQMFFVFLGEGAENGKSTLCEIFKSSFPVYVMDIENDAIDDKCKNDKSLSSCLDKPYRMLWIEEGEKIGKKIKKVVNFESCKIKPLYGEECVLIINFCMDILTNGGMDCNIDNGVLRRGRTMWFGSKFVSDPNLVDEENHIYLADSNLVASFKEDIKMKLALFLYFARYTKQYYEMGINVFKSKFDGCKAAFKEEQAGDDPWETFITERFEKSNDNGDTITKFDMLEYVKNNFGESEYTNLSPSGKWIYKTGVFNKVVANNFKRRGYKYDSQERAYNLAGINERGFFKNIKYVPDGTESDEE